jgi:hypothetical protein
MPNFSNAELLRRYSTLNCHISVALLVSRLEREAMVAKVEGNTALSDAKLRTMSFFQNVLSRACQDERDIRGMTPEVDTRSSVYEA